VDEASLGGIARTLRQSIERLPGVRNVEVSGAREQIVRLSVDPMRFAAAGLSLREIRNAVTSAGFDQPLGEYETGELRANLGLSGRFSTLDELRDLPIAHRDGLTTRLGSVADVDFALEIGHEKTLASLGGKAFAPGVDLAVFKSPGTDTLELIATVKRTLDATPLPPGVELELLADQSVDINRTLADVFNNAWQAVAAVFLVLLVLMGWRAATLAGLAIPITFLGSLALIHVLGLTMNEMVIVGMILALGLLVDVFILVTEGMYEGIDGRGMNFAAAASHTVRSFAMPAFAGQLTTIIAFAPLLMMGGIAGKFIQIIPLTAIICLLVSLLVAFLWCVPMARFAIRERSTRPAGGDGNDSGALAQLTARAAAALEHFLLRRALRSRWQAAAWVGGTAVCFLLSLGVAGTLGVELYPKTDGRYMAVTVELAPETRLEESLAIGQRFGDVLRARPEVANVILYAGRRSPYGLPNLAEQIADAREPSIIGLTLEFTPLAERDRLSYQYAPEIRAQLAPLIAQLPGAKLTVVPQSGGPGGDGIEFVLSGNDLAALRRAAQDLSARLEAIDGVTDVRDNQGAPGLALDVRPRREALRFHGIGLRDLADEMVLAMNESTLARLRMPATADDMDIRMAVAWPSRQGGAGGPSTWDEMAHIRVAEPGGMRIKATSLMEMVPGDMPRVVVRNDGQRAVTVLARPEGATAVQILGTLAPQFPQLMAAHPEVGFALAGAARESAETFSRTGLLFLLTLGLMFAVLVTLFNSFKLPLIILTAVPCALIGTFVGFKLIGMPMSFPAMIGIISLIGIVVNTSIVILDVMVAHTRDGMDVAHAAARGAAERLRPIFSAMLTTVAGLALLSTSSPMWQPLAYAIIFGLLAATFVSLLVVPCVYRLLASDASPALAAQHEPLPEPQS
jgi:multidrug efflux pump subunit AcrB